MVVVANVNSILSAVIVINKVIIIMTAAHLLRSGKRNHRLGRGRLPPREGASGPRCNIVCIKKCVVRCIVLAEYKSHEHCYT